MASDDSTRKQNLLEAAQAATHPHPSGPKATRGRAAAQGGGRGLLLGSFGILAVLVAYLAVAQPEWVFTPPETPEPPEVVAASMRLMLVRERQRVESFKFRTGRLPSSLVEAGGHNPAAELVPEPGGAYIIRALQGGAALELRSTDSVEAFLGNSLQVILSRGSSR